MSISPGPNTGGVYPSTLISGATFYKYEPFSFTFTGGSNFTVSGTLAGYCTATTSNAVFSAAVTGSGTIAGTALTLTSGGPFIAGSFITGVATGTYIVSVTNSSNYVVFPSQTVSTPTTITQNNGFQTVGSVSGETLTVTSTGGTLTYRIYVNNGRFIVTPNIASIVLYQNEPISNTLRILGLNASNITFTAQTLICNTYTTPTLPSALLTFTPSNDKLNFLLSGSSTNVSASSNYYIIGSNSTNGYVVTTSFSIQVSNERMYMLSSNTNVSLTIGNALVPPYPTFEVLTPLTTPVGTQVSFGSSNLPPGLSLVSVASNKVSIQGTPTYPSNTTFTSIVTAATYGLAMITASSTISFGYNSSVIFTSPSTATFYSNVPNSITNTAVLFPVSNAITYTSTALSGFTLGGTTGVLSGTATSNVTIPITATSGLISNVQSVSITVLPVSVTATISPSSTINNIIGQTITPVTITFSSPAYSGSCVQGTPVYSGVPLGLTTAFSGSTVTISGIAYVVATNQPIAITITTPDGTQKTATVYYTFTSDTFTTTIYPTSLSFQQNALITPIQFSVATASQVPITYFYGSGLPPGLYVTPGGTLQGTPTTPTALTSLDGVYATNGYSSNQVTAGLSYSVTADTAHIASSPFATALTVSSTVPTITTTTQTTSGLSLSNEYFNPAVGSNEPNTMTFLTYSYGLVVSPLSISGTLGTCTYPDDIVLPAYTTVYGTFNPNAIPVVFGLSNTNPQVINRFVLGQTQYGFNVYCDFGTSTFSNVASYGTQSQPKEHPHMCMITSNATSTLSNWTGNIVITNGDTQMIVGSAGTPFTFNKTEDFGDGGVRYCIYDASNLQQWVVLSMNNNYIWTSPTPNLFAINWTQLSVGGSKPAVLVGIGSGRVMRMYGTTLLIGGATPNPLVYATFTPSTTSSLTLSNVSNQIISSVYDIATGPVVVAAGQVNPASAYPTTSIQYSYDGITWLPTTGSFNTLATNVMYGNSKLVYPWLALGSNGATPRVAYSSNGIAWTQSQYSFPVGTSLGPLQFDGTYWCFFGTSNSTFTLYQHDALSTTMDTWITTTPSFNDSGITTLYTFPTPIYTIVGTPKPVVYVGATPTGPAITPASQTVLIYQYVPIAPVTFSSSSAAVYFLGSALPPGMTFNASTATISGLSVQLGTFIVAIYAQSSSGVSVVTVTFIVSRATILAKTPNAASYTSFIREKVTADSATSAINDHTTPFEVGPFLLPRPPVIVTAPEICCDTSVKNN